MEHNLFTSNTLQSLTETGWRSGLRNLWRKESRRWWQSWYWQLLLWIVLLDGFTAIFGVANRVPVSASSERIPSSLPLLLIMVLFTIFPAFGTVIMVHGKLLDEQQSGTMAWILSKPVTRSAFLLSKFAALPGMLLTMTVIPGALAYVLIQLLQVSLPSLTVFMLVLLFNASSIMFFYCLTLWLGTLLKKRAAILGIGMFICFVVFQVIFQNSVIAQILLAQTLIFLALIGAFLVAAVVCFFLMFWGFARQEC